MNTLKHITRLTAMAALAAFTALAAAQSGNVIKAVYGTAPSSSSDFTVKLVNEGPEKTVAGFAFKISYEPSQVEFKGVTNNTGASGSRVQYTVGPEVVHPANSGQVQRVISATTTADLTNATNLAEIKFGKKPEFAAPFIFCVEDRLTQPVVDGLQGSDLENIPHTFNLAGVKQ